MGDQLLPGSEPRGPVDAQRGDSDAVMAVCGHPTTRVDRTLDDLELAVVAAPPHELELGAELVRPEVRDSAEDACLPWAVHQSLRGVGGLFAGVGPVLDPDGAVAGVVPPSHVADRRDAALTSAGQTGTVAHDPVSQLEPRTVEPACFRHHAD